MPTFFLVGEMRSGTSWLMDMLNSHPEIYCGAEGTFFGRNHTSDEIPVYEGPVPSLHNVLVTCERLHTWRSLWWNHWGQGAFLWWKEQERWNGQASEGAEDDLRNLTRLAIDYYLAKGLAASGKRIVGDKSPQHTDHVDEIFDLYPDAKIIHIFRDGRDVAVSLMQHYWGMARDRKYGSIFDLEPEEIAKRDSYLGDPEGFLNSGQSIFIEERLRQIASRWRRMVNRASRDGLKLFGPRFFQLRYENLLEKPEENLKPLFEFLSAETDDTVVRQCVEENSWATQYGRPKPRHGWRNVFTERDRQVYEAIAGDTLLKFGYSVG